MAVKPVRSAKCRVLSQGICLCLICLLISACATVPTPTRIALLAPFEGRYREVGYNALYAARLALSDANHTGVELLPVDGGGTVKTATDRAHALVADPQVALVLVMGYAATAPDTLDTFANMPVMVIGEWGAQPVGDRVFVLSNPNLDDLLTIPVRTEITTAARLATPLTGSDILALEQFSKLRSSLDGITIVSSATLPDSEFREQYVSSDTFAPEPGLLASLTYDAVRVAIESVSVSNHRAAVSQSLSNMNYTGLNGEIAFENGNWRNAPMHTYRYDANGGLIPVDGVVE